GGYFRNVYLARAYAAGERFREASVTLLLFTGGKGGRRGVGEGGGGFGAAPGKGPLPETLPRLVNEMNFVFPFFGAPERILEFSERSAQIGYVLATNALYNLWDPQPEMSPMRKTERFKALLRKFGLPNYWRQRGWPDLCRAVGADDFVCD